MLYSTQMNDHRKFVGGLAQYPKNLEISNGRKNHPSFICSFEGKELGSGRRASFS